MKRLISVLLVLAVIVTPIVAVSENSNDDEFITTEETFEDVKAGDVVEVEFEYPDLTEKDMELDGFGLLGYENGKYQFEAERDMDTGYIKLQYKVVKEEIEEEHESGETEEIGEVGEGEGTVINWDQFELGKHGWNLTTHIQYAIRVDAKKYQDYEEIYIIDESKGLDSADNVTVSKLEPNEAGQVENTGLAEFEILENSKGNLVIKLKVDKLNEDEELRYDIGYNMIPLEENYKNEYRVVSKSEYEEIVGKGEGAGETKPEEPEEETPEEPEEDKPEKPIEEPKEDDKPEEEPEEEIELEEPKEEDKPKEEEEEKPVKNDRPRRRPKKDRDPVEPKEDKPTTPKEDTEEPEDIEEPEEEIEGELEEEPIIIGPVEDEQIEMANAKPELEETEEKIEKVENVQTKPKLHTDEALPKTGESKLKVEHIVGLILIGLGLIIRRKK